MQKNAIKFRKIQKSSKKFKKVQKNSKKSKKFKKIQKNQKNSNLDCNLFLFGNVSGEQNAAHFFSAHSASQVFAVNPNHPNVHILSLTNHGPDTFTHSATWTRSSSLFVASILGFLPPAKIMNTKGNGNEK